VHLQTLVITSTHQLGHDPAQFPEPDRFRPERWLRSDSKLEAVNPFAWLSFGYGPRMCVGRCSFCDLCIANTGTFYFSLCKVM